MLRGKEKALYLHTLDRALATLASRLPHEKSAYLTTRLAEFGKKHFWDTSRLPKPGTEYLTLASLIERVRQEYHWLDWQHTDEQCPRNNCGYFKEITVSRESGLPWVFDFMQLHKLKTEAPQLLQRIPAYDALVRSLGELLVTDHVALNTVRFHASELQETALRRNFLERIQHTPLLQWQAGMLEYSVAKKILAVGDETLWHLHGIKFRPEASLFEAYIIDLWQDARDLQITEKNGKNSGNGDGIVSDAFRKALDFGVSNAPWYVLRSLDETFESLHPVHVTRALLGPSENQYRTQPKEIPALPVTEELLKENNTASLLRMSRQYAYAPNHEIVKGNVRQIITREVWSDEFIVTPAEYAPKVSASVAGTNVRVYEIGKVGS